MIKLLIPISLFALVLSHAKSAHADEGDDSVCNVSLTIAKPSGSEVVLEVEMKMKEKGDSFISYMNYDFTRIFSFSVLDSQGKAVPLTQYGKEVTKPIIYKDGEVVLNSSQALSPGSREVFRVPLSRMYDVSLSGKYTVSFRAPVVMGHKGKMGHSFTIVSIPKSFEVVPFDSSQPLPTVPQSQMEK